MTAKILTLEERFWAKVDKRGPNDCWEWQGSRQHFGHGLFRQGPRIEKAHRVSYAMANGAIADGLIVRHRCDNPPCVNPAHLETGTRADNVRDRDSRGRHVALKGTAHHGAILSNAAVREIRSAPRSYGLCQALAARFGVAVGTIYNIRSSAASWVDAR